MSIDRERCRITEPFSVPAAVALSQFMGVDGSRWTSSLRVSRITRPSLAFMKSAPSYASAAEDATNFITLHSV